LFRSCANVIDGRKCKVSWLEDNDSEYANILKDIKSKLPKEAYLTPNHLELIDKIKGVKRVQKKKATVAVKY